MTTDADLKAKIRARMQHTGEPYTVARDGLLARRLPPLPSLDHLSPADRAEFRATAKAFFNGRTLVERPVRPGKLWVVLQVLATSFERGRTYTEPEVNQALSEFDPDYAAWRRELVNHRLLAREGGEYWVVGPEQASLLR